MWREIVEGVIFPILARVKFQEINTYWPRVDNAKAFRNGEYVSGLFPEPYQQASR